MKFYLFFVLAGCIGCNSITASAAVDDPCDNSAKLDSDIRLELISARLDTSNTFIGLFRITNRKNIGSITLGLTRGRAGRTAFRPDTSIEYTDLSKDWRRLISLPGSFHGVDYMYELKPGKSYTFRAILFPRETANMNAGEFRMILRTYNPRQCIISVPFQGIPKRISVVELKSTGA